MEKQTILFYGKSGSGKGTQAKKLVEVLGEDKTLYIETGARIRQFMNKDGFTSERTKELIDEGGLLPEFLPIWIWANVLVEEYTNDKHLILDGLARRVHESSILDTTFKFYKIEKPTIILIDVSREWAKKHLLERGRADDTEESVEERLDWYDENVTPAMNFFKDNSYYNFITVNGEQTIDEVHEEIKQKLNLN